MPQSMPPLQIHCASLFDGVNHSPHGHTLVLHEGRIAQVETSHLAADPRLYWCPGWVNLHSHLELSSLQGKLPQGVPFPDWVTALQEQTQSWSTTDFQRSFAQGYHQAWSAGTTSLYDVGNRYEARYAHANGPRLWALHEILGLRPPSEPFQRPSVPHALFSTHAERVIHAVQSCIDATLPWSIHLAESEAEQEILTQGSGPFRTWLDQRIPTHPFLGNGARPLARLLGILDSAGQGCTHGLIIHGNYLDISELRELAKRDWPLVHCPQSRAWFSHPLPDWNTWKQAAIDICVATDSLASAQSLDPRAQLRTLREQSPNCFAPEELLRMITSIPGRHLNRSGRIIAGATADLVCLRLPEGVAPERFPEAALDPETRVHSVWIQGIETIFDKDTTA